MTEKELVQLLKKIGEVALKALLISVFLIYWAARISWWLFLAFLMLVGLFIGFCRLMSAIGNGEDVSFRRGKVNFPRFPGMPKFPDGWKFPEEVEAVEVEQAQKIVEKDEKVKDYLKEAPPDVLKAVEKLRSLRPGKLGSERLMWQLDEDDCQIIFFLIMISLGMKIEFED
jgi:hypothetical protein